MGDRGESDGGLALSGWRSSEIELRDRFAVFWGPCRVHYEWAGRARDTAFHAELSGSVPPFVHTRKRW